MNMWSDVVRCLDTHGQETGRIIGRKVGQSAILHSFLTANIYAINIHNELNNDLKK